MTETIRIKNSIVVFVFGFLVEPVVLAGSTTRKEGHCIGMIEGRCYCSDDDHRNHLDHVDFGHRSVDQRWRREHRKPDKFKLLLWKILQTAANPICNEKPVYFERWWQSQKFENLPYINIVWKNHCRREQIAEKAIQPAYSAETRYSTSHNSWARSIRNRYHHRRSSRVPAETFRHSLLLYAEKSRNWTSVNCVLPPPVCDRSDTKKRRSHSDNWGGNEVRSRRGRFQSLVDRLRFPPVQKGNKIMIVVDCRQKRRTRPAASRSAASDEASIVGSQTVRWWHPIVVGGGEKTAKIVTTAAIMIAIDLKVVTHLIVSLSYRDRIVIVLWSYRRCMPIPKSTVIVLTNNYFLKSII